MTKKFGDNSKSYDAKMRTQLWPLCCGAKIISGFKAVQDLEPEELVKQIVDICDNYIPDHQVFGGETINPKLTFLTLNSGQMASPKIMKAIEAAGFVQFGAGKPRGSEQGFFLRDTSKSFRLQELKEPAAACGC